MGQIDEIQFKSVIIDETLKNFIYKHTKDLKIVQRNKKKEKGKVTGRLVTPN